MDLHLVSAARDVLDYTTEDIEHLDDEKFNGKFAPLLDSVEMRRELDKLCFQCNFCSYWKPQRENGTPDASTWTCKECVTDGV